MRISKFTKAQIDEIINTYHEVKTYRGVSRYLFDKWGISDPSLFKAFNKRIEKTLKIKGVPPYRYGVDTKIHPHKILSDEENSFVVEELNKNPAISRKQLLIKLLETYPKLKTRSPGSITKIVERIKGRFNKTDGGVLNNIESMKEAASRVLKRSKYYLITWEQNETELHENFWNNLLAYKDYLGAELSVVLGRYENPTSVFRDSKRDNWNLATRPYWDLNRHNIHPFLHILSDAKIQPTAKKPLQGISGLTRYQSIVVGHPKLHLVAAPTLRSYPTKVLFTTGAVTKANYTDSKAGALGANNHKNGFVIVEIKDNKKFFIRQVEADDEGNFIDLVHEVTNGKVSTIDKALGMICGDTHLRVLDPKMDNINSILCNRFKFDHVVYHDIVDGESCNLHLENSPIKKAIRYERGESDMTAEIVQLEHWLSGKLKYKPVVIASNHNKRFDRVLELKDWRNDPQNSKHILKWALQSIEDEEVRDLGIIAYSLKSKLGDAIEVIRGSDSFTIGRYECSQHGDIGINGAKGNPTGFSDLNDAIILAHSHTPYRANDCMYVGTNTYLRLDYNSNGLSTWVQSNAIIHKNGIAQQLIFIDGECTTFPISE